jgi:hypothetical protein
VKKRMFGKKGRKISKVNFDGFVKSLFCSMAFAKDFLRSRQVKKMKKEKPKGVEVYV